MNTWEMFGYPKGDGSNWLKVDDYRTVKMHGCADPVPVLVIEDPEGDYLGWLDETDSPRNNGIPEMITHKRLFNINFAYGYEEEEKAGRGRAIPLTIREAS